MGKLCKSDIIGVISLFLFYFSINASGQKAFEDADRARYLFYVASNVVWPNEASIDTFVIAYLGKSESLKLALENEYQTQKSLKNKPVKFIQFDKIDDIKTSDVLYINKIYGFNIFEVYDKIWDKHTLLISENYPYHQSMLNFINYNGKHQFEVNERKFESAGLTTSKLFLAHAVKNKEDWEKVYEQTEMELQKEKKTVAVQAEKIISQTQTIETQTELIENQNNQIAKQQMELLVLNNDILAKQNILNQKTAELSRQEHSLTTKVKEIERAELQLKELNQKSEIQTELITSQKTSINKQLQEIEKQKLFLYMSLIVIGLFIFLAYYIYRAYRIKKRSNLALEAKNKVIAEQKAEAEKQRDQIAHQKEQILASINYAQRIQRAILPEHEQFASCLNHFFILYKPKDIVSGDFYWQAKIGDEVIIVAADCTGHGVPGAFMSMLGITFLNDIVNRRQVVVPNEILNALRDDIVKALHQEHKEAQLRDGMDIVVCNINTANNKVQFAGANNPLLLIRNNEVMQYKGDKMPVSLHEKMLSFTNQEIELQKDDALYIFSDGYIDQFGGGVGKKFMIKQLKERLLTLQPLPMNEQKDQLDQIFEDWRGTEHQIDDVLLIGVRI